MMTLLPHGGSITVTEESSEISCLLIRGLNASPLHAISSSASLPMASNV